MSRFWFHFNKPASRKAGHPVMTVHTGGKCLLVRAIVCKGPTCTRERPTQPRMVIAGQGNVVVTEDAAGNRTATITAD
jgi:hypothetical protein